MIMDSLFLIELKNLYVEKHDFTGKVKYKYDDTNNIEV